MQHRHEDMWFWHSQAEPQTVSKPLDLFARPPGCVADLWKSSEWHEACFEPKKIGVVFAANAGCGLIDWSVATACIDRPWSWIVILVLPVKAARDHTVRSTPVLPHPFVVDS